MKEHTGREIMTTLIKTIAIVVLFGFQATFAFLNNDEGPVHLEIFDADNNATYGLAPGFTRVNILITDAVAQIQVQQTFTNPLNTVSEVAYVFPLPHKGAVHAMSYEQKGKLYTAKILERSAAQAIYDSIQNAGGSASLLLQERENVFTQKLANLDAGESVTVNISLSMPLDYIDGVFELAFPTMVATRCCNADTDPIEGTLGGWNPPALVKGPTIEFNIAIQTGTPLKSITSPTHPLEFFSTAEKIDQMVERGALPNTHCLKQPHQRLAFLQQLETYPNKDFVLRLERTENEPSLSVATWAPSTESDRFFMVHLFPQPLVTGKSETPVDALLLIDISGSQSGWPLEYEKQAALAILDQLGENDRVCVMAFAGMHVFAFSDTLRAATATNIAIAKSFIQTLTAGGGTELHSALTALMEIPNPSNHHRVNVLFTDGFITNDTQILAYLSKLDPEPQMITLGAGNNVNRAFLDAAAEIGNGFSTVFTYNEDPSLLATTAWTRVTSPQIENLSLHFSTGSYYDLVQPTGDALYPGMPYRAYGRTSANGPVTVTLSGMSGTTPVSYSQTVDFGATDSSEWVIPKLWAKANIHELELAEGYTTANKDTILATSLTYQVLSRYSAFLAFATNEDAEDYMLTSLYQERPGIRFNESTRPSVIQVSPIHQGFHFDWTGYQTLQAIRIYDLHGHLVAEYHPHSVETCWNFVTADFHGQRLVLQAVFANGVENTVLPPLL